MTSELTQSANSPQEPDDSYEIETLKRFVKCASAGGRGAASHGEQIANRIAKALLKIGDDFAILDSGLIDGIAEMMRQMSGPWPTDEYKAAVFATLRKAAR